MAESPERSLSPFCPFARCCVTSAQEWHLWTVTLTLDAACGAFHDGSYEFMIHDWGRVALSWVMIGSGILATRASRKTQGESFVVVDRLRAERAERSHSRILRLSFGALSGTGCDDRQKPTWNCQCRDSGSGSGSACPSLRRSRRILPSPRALAVARGTQYIYPPAAFQHPRLPTLVAIVLSVVAAVARVHSTTSWQWCAIH